MSSQAEPGSLLQPLRADSRAHPRERENRASPPTGAQMGNVIRMGFIGGGRALQEIHLPLFSHMEEVLPLVLCDIRQSALKSALRKFGIRETTDQWQDVVGMREIDAVLITLPNDLHAEVAEKALRAGKHVLCEKPAALDVAGAQSIARAARESGRIYLLALPHRFDVEATLLRQLIATGRLGRIHHVRAGMVKRDACPAGWFTQRSRSGGGALVQLGSHLVDLAVWLMDFPRVERVSAVIWQSSGPLPAGLASPSRDPVASKSDVEDAATVLMRLDAGRSVTLECAWKQHTEHDREYLEVYGDRGGASLWPLRVSVEVDGVDSVIHPRYEPASSYQVLARHFVDLILDDESGRRGLAPLTCADDGVRLAWLTEYIYQSARAGREIEIPAPALADSRGARL